LGIGSGFCPDPTFEGQLNFLFCSSYSLNKRNGKKILVFSFLALCESSLFGKRQLEINSKTQKKKKNRILFGTQIFIKFFYQLENLKE